MGWITNIYFPEGVELNDTKIRPGMSTQVRWDLGIGEITIDKEGKIVADKVLHMFPLHEDEARAYEKEIATWTGIFDTNMGVLFFKEGQLCHLDLSYEDVGSWAVNYIDIGWNKPGSQNLCGSIAPKDWGRHDAHLDLYRSQLLADCAICNYSWTVARQRYKERSGELIDPFYKEPTPNGFVRN